MAGPLLKHAVVEIVNTTDKVAGGVDNTNSMVRAISASEAFRQYNWLSDAPILNSAGDLRGMVLSAQWRTAFQVTTKIGDVAGKIATIAALAANIVKASGAIDSILNSKDSWDVKGAKLSTQVSSVAIRTVTGVVPAGVDLLTKSLSGYCMLAGVVTNSRFQPQSCVAKLSQADVYVQTTFDKVTDGNNIYMFLNVTITPRVSRLLGN